MKLQIFIDGAVSNNVHRENNVGAWAAIIRANGKDIHQMGYEENTTNQRMEVAGITEILPNVLERGASDIEIISDSMYLLRGFNEGLASRKKRLKKNKLPNADLWQPIFELLEVYKPQITTTWVKGHNGHTENEICNAMAESFVKQRLRIGWL